MAERGLITRIQVMTIVSVHYAKKNVGIHQNGLLQKLSIIYKKGVNAKQLKPHTDWLQGHYYVNELRVSVKKVLEPTPEGIAFITNLPSDLTQIERVNEYYDRVDRLFD